jgi:hypothetical protein
MMISKLKSGLFVTFSPDEARLIDPYTNFTIHMKKLLKDQQPIPPVFMSLFAEIHNLATGDGNRRGPLGNVHKSIAQAGFAGFWLVGMKSPLPEELLGMLDWNNGIRMLDKELPLRSTRPLQQDCFSEFLYGINMVVRGRDVEYYEPSFTKERINRESLHTYIKKTSALSKLITEPFNKAKFSLHVGEFFEKLAICRGTNTQLVEKVIGRI